MTKILSGIIAAMCLSALLYYNFSVVPMKNKLEEQIKVIAAQELRDQEQRATIEAIQGNLQKTTEALSGLQSQNQQYTYITNIQNNILTIFNLIKQKK